jgi:hypothetical protein
VNHKKCQNLYHNLHNLLLLDQVLLIHHPHHHLLLLHPHPHLLFLLPTVIPDPSPHLASNKLLEFDQNITKGIKLWKKITDLLRSGGDKCASDRNNINASFNKMNCSDDMDNSDNDMEGSDSEKLTRATTQLYSIHDGFMKASFPLSIIQYVEYGKTKKMDPIVGSHSGLMKILRPDTFLIKRLFRKPVERWYQSTGKKRSEYQSLFHVRYEENVAICDALPTIEETFYKTLQM